MKKFTVYLNGPYAAPLLWQMSPSEFFLGDGGLRHVAPEHLDFASRVVHCGDFDSVTPLKQKKLEDTCKARGIDYASVPKPEQNFSDFGLILDTIAQTTNEPVFVQILGGLGGSLDHELVNIFEACAFVTKFKHAAVVSFEPRVVVFKGELKLDSVSVFSLVSPDLAQPHDVRIQGARYEGEGKLLRPSHGLSNRVTSETLKLFSEQTLIFEARTMKGEKDE